MYRAYIVECKDCGPLVIAQSLQECAEVALRECEDWGDTMLDANITATIVTLHFSDHLNGNTYTVMCEEWPHI